MLRLTRTRQDDADWCNGSTTDSDSVCEGSSPSSVVENLREQILNFLFKRSSGLYISECGSAWQSATFGTQRSRVRITSLRLATRPVNTRDCRFLQSLSFNKIIKMLGGVLMITAEKVVFSPVKLELQIGRYLVKIQVGVTITEQSFCPLTVGMNPLITQKS